ncbi:MAG: hypothetical protein M0009_02175 [Deltaproteobacteria bacterium]|nr:hypothetical protein [Deltaproteobacteria bacterium]
MTQTDKGHYAAKHRDAKVDEGLAAAVQAKSVGGKLSCPAAEALAAELAVTMAEIGKTADLLEVRINGCQLGLFGHSPAEKGVKPAEEVSHVFETLIRSRLVGGPAGPMPCAAAWEIAKLRKMPRLEVSSACEKLGIKIKPCQLGAF